MHAHPGEEGGEKGEKRGREREREGGKGKGREGRGKMVKGGERWSKTSIERERIVPNMSTLFRFHYIR